MKDYINKLEKWQLRHNFWHDVRIKFSWLFFVSLIKFTYWSKFHANIITGFGVMTIFFYKGLIRILEIGREDLNFKLRFHFKTLSWNWYPKAIFFHKELTRNWEIRLGSLSFVSNQILLNAENCRVTALPFSGLLSEKKQGEGELPSQPPPPNAVQGQ